MCYFTYTWVVAAVSPMRLGGFSVSLWGWGTGPGRDAKGQNEEERYLLALSYSCPSISWSSSQGCDCPSPLPGCITWSLSSCGGQTLPCGVSSKAVGGARDAGHLASVVEPVCQSISRRAEQAAGLGESWSYRIGEPLRYVDTDIVDIQAALMSI